MHIRSWWANRVPGTGRMIALLCVFGPLSIYLAWATFVAPDDSLPHPVVAEYRLVLMDGKPLSPVTCYSRRPGGRMVLGADGRWWMQVTDCRARYGVVIGSGIYRWSGDTLALYRRDYARSGGVPRHVVVPRGDTLDIPSRHSQSPPLYRFVRVHTPASPPAP